jgi:hypothetical protein
MPFRHTGDYVPPPRASVALDPMFLPQKEAEGMWAQVKKNGTHTLIHIHPDRKVVAWDRYGEQQKAWHFTEATSRLFRAIPGNAWYIIDGELIHNKTKHIKEQLYLYDILVCDGINLIGTNYEFRYQVLIDVMAQGREFGEPTPETHYWRLDEHVSIARNYKSGFAKLFASLTAPEDEGLVCRNPTMTYTGPKADSWMVKFRRKEITKLY